MNRDLQTTLSKAQEKASRTNPQLANRIAQVYDDLKTMNTINNLDLKFPTADVMKAVSEAVNSLGTTSENEIGDLEVMGFSYQKNDKDSSKKR